jgi:hypothetical protein
MSFVINPRLIFLISVGRLMWWCLPGCEPHASSTAYTPFFCHIWRLLQVNASHVLVDSKKCCECFADVAKVGLDVVMLHICITRVASVLCECCISHWKIWMFQSIWNICCNGFAPHFRWMIITIFNIFLMLQTLNFDVADVEVRCCIHVMLGVVSRGWGEGSLCWMLHATRVATWVACVLYRGGGGRRGPWC